MAPSVALDCTPLIGRSGGVGTFTRGALGGLAARGVHDLAAYALSWRAGNGLQALVPTGVRVLRRRLPAAAMLRAWEYGPWPWAELWTGRVDLVHGTNFVVPPARRAATVVTVHDLTAVRFPHLCTAVTLRYPTLVRRAVQRGAFVHVPSAYVAREVIEDFAAPPERVRVVAHGVDHVAGDAQGSVDSGSRPAAGVDNGPPYVLALGTVEPRKDYPGLVHAFDIVAADDPDVRLVIAGEDGWGAESLADAVAASPNRSRIVRRAGVEDGDRERLLAGAQLLAYPSVYEGFGFPPLEAMAVGTPVVATAAGAVPDTVGDAALVVPAGDPDALAAAMVSVLLDNDLRASLQTRGRERARAFTWDACARGLADLYADAIVAART